jgi:hypothetical protein
VTDYKGQTSASKKIIWMKSVYTWHLICIILPLWTGFQFTYSVSQFLYFIFIISKDEEFSGFIALEQMYHKMTDMPLGKEGRSEW